MKNKIALGLFGLVFFGVGIGMLVWILVTLNDARRAEGWEAVPARVISGGYTSHEGEDSTTYKAYAEYAYSYRGRDYTGTRVALEDTADNIGDYQQELGNRLSEAARTGAPVDIYVNPDAPEEAIIDRDIRWGMVAFKSIFVIAFGGAGAGIMLFAFLSPRPKDTALPEYAAAPWLANDKWTGEAISSHAGFQAGFVWVFAVIWNAISMPLPFLLYPEVTEKGNHAALLGLLFPLVGIGMFVWAVRATIQWRKFGKIPLRLDPFPGSIGGHVGGVIETRLPYDPAARFIVTLSSLHSYVSGSGKNRSRAERVNWQDSAVAHAEMGLYGTRIAFRFDVPEGLPPSDAVPETEDYELWRLNLRAEMPGVDLDRDYEIPVYPTGAASSLGGREIETAARATQEMHAAGAQAKIRMLPGPMGTELFYPAGRNIGPALTALFAGAVFTGGGVFMAWHESMYFFGGVFLLFGIPITLGGIYMVSNSLHLRKNGSGGIESRRRIFGIPVRRRHAYPEDLAPLETSSSFSAGTGNKHVKHYSVHARLPDGRKMVFGEGFHGEAEARAAMRIIEDALGLPRRSEAPS